MICPHGMPSPSTCIDCMADGPVAPPLREPRRAEASGSGYVEAQYEGWCSGCDSEVLSGERIVEESPGAGRWGHLACLRS